MTRRASAILVLAGIAALRVAAAPPAVSVAGSFSSDDDKQEIFFTLTTPGTVTVQTSSFAQGGFDPTLSVYDASGNLVAFNQDGGCLNVAQDPLTGFCWDSFVQVSLPAGNYTAVLTESENLPNGPTLADSFVYSGQGNFTALTPGGPGFFDLTLRQRTPTFTVNVAGAGAILTPTIYSSSSLPSGVTGQPYQFAFAAQSGPNVALTWSVSGSVPPGLTIDPVAGVLAGQPLTPGTYSFTVQATDGVQPVTQTVTVLIFSPITINSTSLPSGVVNQSYSAVALGLSGGSGSATWTATGLPPGLSISSTGVISGIPTAGGTFDVQVSVSDPVSGLTQSATVTLAISFAPLQITGSGSLGGFTPGKNVFGTPGVKGGLAPYTWSVLPPGMPAGFNLDPSTGAFSGVAPGPGTYSFSIEVSDSQSPPATATLSVSFSVLGITTSSVAPATVGLGYSQSFGAIGGTGPYTFSGTGIPAGLTLSSAGLLSGLPVNAGTSSFTVTVSDSTGLKSQSGFSLVVNGTSPLSTSGGPLTNSSVLTAYTTTLPVKGGSPPYTWTLVGGALPDGGFSLSPSGAISGTPKTPGTYTFTAQVTDSAKNNSSGTFTIKVDPQSLTLQSVASFPSGIVGSEYPLQILTATGGVAPYTFTISGSAGSSPARGLVFSSPQISGIPTASGTFLFTVTLTDAAGRQVVANGSINITPAHADLIISQSTVPFSVMVGAGGVPPPASVPVRSSVIQQLLNFSVTETPAVSWLDLSGGGTTPGSVGLMLDSSALSLPAGAPYQTTVNVTCLAPSPCAGNTQKIVVSLTVSDFSPVLTPTNSLLSFYAATSNPQASTQTLGIQNTGGGVLTINSVTVADSWLAVTGAPTTLASGPAVDLTVTANPAGLSAGFYRSSITINSSAGMAIVPVTLDLTQNPVMSLAPEGQQFQAVAGNPPGETAESFNVSVLGTASASWTATVLPGANWLSVSTPSGVATPAVPGTVNFAIDPAITAGLAAQTYYGIISVTSASVVDSPLFYEVVLNVTPATIPGRPGLSTGGVIFTSGAASPTSSQTIQLFASSTAPTQYQASAQTVDGASWLSVSPTTGTASSSVPAQSVISATSTGLAPGVYHGGVSYAFASDGVRTVNVTLLVLSAGSSPNVSSRANGAKANASVSNVCTPTRLVPAQVGLVNNFSEQAGWPTPLAINVMDDCGSPVTTAEVVSTFSNGDPPLVLRAASTSSATFVGTWTPRAVSSQVTIAAQASAPNFPVAPKLLITGAVTSNNPPILTPHGTVHVFNPQAGAALAPGTIVAIYGSNLSGGVAPSSIVPLTTSLGGTTVLIGGVPAPLYYVSPGQINAQIPFGLAPGNSYQVLVNTNGGLSTPDTLQVMPVDPGIAAYTTGQIIAQHAADYSLVTESSPAVPGEYLIFYLAGLGATDNPVSTGGPSPSDPLARTLTPPVLTLNGNPVPFVFAGLTPTAVGLYQINFQVPAGTAGGDLTLLVNQAGSPANSTILPVAK